MDADRLPIWARGERRPARGGPGLSVEQIVAAAVKIADAEGLAAVSMRRIAADLGAGVMSLYRHVSTKDDLMDLMLDTVVVDLAEDDEPPPLGSGPLAQDLRSIGYGLRAQIHRHPWMPQLMSGRPAFGPNMVRVFEIAMSVFDGLDVRPAVMMNAIGTINAFVHGFVQQELAEREMTRNTGLTEREWQERMGPYMQSLLESGKYPRLARLMTEADGHDDEFDTQLDIVIDGVLNTLPAAARRPAPKRRPSRAAAKAKG